MESMLNKDYFSRFMYFRESLSLAMRQSGLNTLYGQFDMLQWIKGAIKIREASCFAITAPIPSAIHKSMRLLAL
jgi:hypothetical protein